MNEHQDAYGRLVLDHFEGRPRTHEIVERDDGFIAASDVAPASYFAPVRRWPRDERRGLRFVRGRVLDVGAGAGRVALELQARGLQVVATDVSPLAIEVCRRRGVRRAEVLPFDRIDGRFGVFDTVVMYGNNFGLFGGRRRALQMLRRLHRLTSARGRIVAQSNDPYTTDEPEHLAYQERNRRRGRMAGQLRLRVRHRDLATPWFDYLIAAPGEVSVLAADTGWRLARVVEGDGGLYVAVLEKD